MYNYQCAISSKRAISLLKTEVLIMLTVETQKVDKAALEQKSLFCVNLPLSLHNDSTGQRVSSDAPHKNCFGLSSPLTASSFGRRGSLFSHPELLCSDQLQHFLCIFSRLRHPCLFSQQS